MTTMTTENNSNGNKSTFGTVGQSEVGDGASNVESKIYWIRESVDTKLSV